jgi:hypothetical protein
MEFFMLAPAPLTFSVSASMVGGRLNLAFPTVQGHNYTVVYKSSLTATNWTTVGSAMAGTGSVTNVLQTLSGGQGYYAISAH